MFVKYLGVVFALMSSGATKASAADASDRHFEDKQLELSRAKVALPNAPAAPKIAPSKPNLAVVKPPRSNDFYEGGGKDAQYERLVDQEIRQLYGLSKKYEKSRNRGELWLRLAERYVEKARLVGFRAQADFDQKAKDFLEKKTRVKPKLDDQVQREYNRKAVELYEWFVNGFPTDPKIDQALFFLGFNWFELGDVKKGEYYYLELTKRYPNSSFVIESYFALGEYYFENERWQEALENFTKVVAQKKARLNTFALYKAAWCLFRLNRTPASLKMLERVIRLGGASEGSEGGESRRAVNKIRLASEATKDYVPFYADTGEYQNARAEFLRVTGDEKQATKMAERLAYAYADAGNRKAANALFKQLIALDPTAEKAADYQYQIALTHQTSDQRLYRQEMESWLENFGPKSVWARENAKNPKVVDEMSKLQELTVRNFVLGLHQAAQNSRAQFSQQQASASYGLYSKHFSTGPKALEMTFFHAELLFDMEKREEAARLYTSVVERDPKGPYAEKAALNALLALEKELPSQKQIDDKRGKSIEPIPLDPAAERFEKAVQRYLAIKPKGEQAVAATRRLGVLFYSYNQFDKAIETFERILRDHPKTEDAEVAGNLILDIYKLKGDMGGLVAQGEKFLANPQIARSKLGTQVKGMLEKATYLNAEKLAEKKDYSKAAREFERFSVANKGSDLAEAARYKSAANYEKAGDIGSSIRMHGIVLAVPSNDAKIKAIQNDSRNDLARLYSQTAQLEMAAKQYETYAGANPKDAKAINAYYNAGVLYDALGEREAAVRNYDAYYSKSSKADRVEILFLEAELRRKSGDREKATSVYERYLRESSRVSDRAVQSHYWIAKAAERAGQGAKTKAAYQKVVETHKSSKQGVRYAAEARFRLARETLAQIESIKFQASEKQQAQAAQQTETLRKKYLEEMKDVIRYDHAPYIVAALASTGQMFEALAAAYSKVPAPPGYSADDAKKLQELTDARANGFRVEAKNAYKAAYDRALELESYDEWTKLARVGLAKYDPAAVGADAGEVAAPANAADWMGM